MPALDPQFATLAPFEMTADSQFRPAGPPALTSAQYAVDLNQVESLGSATSATRTADQTQIARFWADGSGTFVPAGHWNVIATSVAASKGFNLAQDAQLLGELDMGMGDAGIVAWDSKYAYNFWRPITAIQNANTDGNAATTADPTWTPLLTTPAFSSYVSGHATYSGTGDAILAAFFGENTGFTLGTQAPALAGITAQLLQFQPGRHGSRHEPRLCRHPFLHRFDGRPSAGEALGKYVVAKLNAAGPDTLAPTVSYLTTQTLMHTNLPISGYVFDNLSGVASISGQFDKGATFPITLDSSGHFSVTSALALTGSADGAHVLHLIARDKAGNVSGSYNFSFTLDTKAPTISITSPTATRPSPLPRNWSARPPAPGRHWPCSPIHWMAAPPFRSRSRPPMDRSAPSLPLARLASARIRCSSPPPTWPAMSPSKPSRSRSPRICP